MAKLINFLTKLIIWFFIVLTFVFFYFSLFDKQIILNALDYMKHFVSQLWYWNYLIILVFGFIESFPLVWISVPWQTVLLIIAGFLGYSHMYLAMFCAALGAILWNFFGYLLGKKYWDSFFDKYGKFIWVTNTDIKYVKKWMNKYWWLLVVWGKFHNMFRAFVPFIAGSAKIGDLKFAILNFIGSVLRAVVMVFVWIYFVDNAEKILANIWKILLVIAVVILAYTWYFHKDEFKKYLEEKQKDL